MNASSIYILHDLLYETCTILLRASEISIAFLILVFLHNRYLQKITNKIKCVRKEQLFPVIYSSLVALSFNYLLLNAIDAFPVEHSRYISWPISTMAILILFAMATNDYKTRKYHIELISIVIFADISCAFADSQLFDQGFKPLWLKGIAWDLLLKINVPIIEQFDVTLKNLYINNLHTIGTIAIDWVAEYLFPLSMALSLLIASTLIRSFKPLVYHSSSKTPYEFHRKNIPLLIFALALILALLLSSMPYLGNEYSTSHLRDSSQSEEPLWRLSPEVSRSFEPLMETGKCQLHQIRISEDEIYCRFEDGKAWFSGTIFHRQNGMDLGLQENSMISADGNSIFEYERLPTSSDCLHFVKSGVTPLLNTITWETTHRERMKSLSQPVTLENEEANLFSDLESWIRDNSFQLAILFTLLLYILTVTSVTPTSRRGLLIGLLLLFSGYFHWFDHTSSISYILFSIGLGAGVLLVTINGVRLLPRRFRKQGRIILLCLLLSSITIATILTVLCCIMCSMGFLHVPDVPDSRRKQNTFIAKRVIVSCVILFVLTIGSCGIFKKVETLALQNIELSSQGKQESVLLIPLPTIDAEPLGLVQERAQLACKKENKNLVRIDQIKQSCNEYSQSALNNKMDKILGKEKIILADSTNGAAVIVAGGGIIGRNWETICPVVFLQPPSMLVDESFSITDPVALCQ